MTRKPSILSLSRLRTVASIGALLALVSADDAKAERGHRDRSVERYPVARKSAAELAEFWTNSYLHEKSGNTGDHPIAVPAPRRQPRAEPHEGDSRALVLSTLEGERIAQHTPYDFGNTYCPHCGVTPFGLQILPDGAVYQTYLAGVKESRMSAVVFNEVEDGWLYDASLGGRFGLLRYGTRDSIRPEGFQLDFEGSAQVRLDIPEDIDVRSVDYRAGIAFSWGDRYRQTKLGYYHVSSHLGDEFLLKNHDFDRINFVRDVLVLGHSVYFRDNIRVYGEVGWAFHLKESDPFEFQVGLDYAPQCPTSIHGAPFFALNGLFRQDVNYSGSLTVQLGQAWRSEQNGGLLRIGLQYFNGQSNQLSFFHEHEQQIGMGIWYDR